METMPAILSAPRLLNTAEIRECLADGSPLLLAERRKEAGDRIWSAFEASVRFSLTELGEQTDDPIWISNSPEGLSSQAVAYGVIDPEDREPLLQFLSQRDAARQQNNIIDAETLRQVEYITERTLGEMSSNNGAAKVVQGDYQMPLTTNDVIAFINAHPGHTYYTTGKQEKPFTVIVNGRKFAYTISSGNIYAQTESDMDQLLQKFAQTHSLKPSDYHHPKRQGSRFSSYFVGLMSAIKNGSSSQDN